MIFGKNLLNLLWFSSDVATPPILEMISIVMMMMAGGILGVIIGIVLITVVVAVISSYLQKAIGVLDSGSIGEMKGVLNEALWYALINMATMGVGILLGKVVMPAALRSYTILRYGEYSDDIARGFRNGIKYNTLRDLLDYGFDSGFVERFGLYGDDAGKRLLGVLDNYGNLLGNLVDKYGDDVYRYFAKYGPEGIDDIGRYGDDVVGIFGKYGDDGVRALNGGISVELINRLADYGIVPSQYGRYNIVSGEVAETIVEAVESIISNAKAAQRFGGYIEDTFSGTILTKGTKIYGLTPGQTAWYTTAEMLETSGYSYKDLYDGLQITPDPVRGYRQFITEYEVTEDVVVATGKALANTTEGNGGYIQYYIDEFSKFLNPVKEITLHE